MISKIILFVWLMMKRWTAANLRAALPDMDKEMVALACQTANKLDAMSDADFAAQRFHFTDE